MMPKAATPADPPGSNLSSAKRIALVGDIRGHFGNLFDVFEAVRKLGVSHLIALSDFGLTWAQMGGPRSLELVTSRLEGLELTFYLIEGAQEEYARVTARPTENGMRALSERILLIPRGYRQTFASGTRLGAMGSPDHVKLQGYVDEIFWPQEAISETDLVALGNAPVDCLLGGDAPLDVQSLDSYLEHSRRLDPLNTADGESQRSRKTIHEAFLNVRPKLYVGSHYGFHVDETVGYYDGFHGFACRVALLDQISSEAGTCCAILDTESLELEFFDSLGRPTPKRAPQVTSLSMESGGRWALHTLRGTQQILDLDARTWVRVPGPHSEPNNFEGLQRLRSIEEVRIGRPGRWTMPGDYLNEYYWAQSSVVRHIERLPNE